MTRTPDVAAAARQRAVAAVDNDIAQVLRAEINRQNMGLELIASENFASAAVLEAMGTVMSEILPE